MKGLLRFLMVLLTMVTAVVAALVIAATPTGLNTTDEPADSWLSMLKLISLFIPPLILSFFHNLTVRIISAVYQGLFILLMFLMFMLIGVIAPDGGYWIRMIGMIGVIMSITSIVITIVLKKNKANHS